MIRSKFSEKSTIVNNCSIAYYDEGEGDNILFIHGWVSNKDLYHHLMERLYNSHRVIALDLPGFGNSSPVLPGENMENFINIIRDFQKKLNIENPSLIGNSFGGILSMIYTVTYPKNVRQAIVRGAPIHFSQLPTIFTNPIIKNILRIASLNKRIRESMAQIVKRHYIKYLSARFGDPRMDLADNSTKETIIGACEKNFEKISLEVAREVIFNMLKLDLIPILEHNHGNIIYIINKNDTLVKHKKTLYKNLPNFTIIENNEQHTILDIDIHQFEKIRKFLD